MGEIGGECRLDLAERPAYDVLDRRAAVGAQPPLAGALPERGLAAVDDQRAGAANEIGAGRRVDQRLVAIVDVPVQRAQRIGNGANAVRSRR
jgi:hypothetical protein